jgi:hypothetical protein
LTGLVSTGLAEELGDVRALWADALSSRGSDLTGWSAGSRAISSRKSWVWLRRSWVDGRETRRCLRRALMVDALGVAGEGEWDGPAGGAWGVLGVTNEYSMADEWCVWCWAAWLNWSESMGERSL